MDEEKEVVAPEAEVVTEPVVAETPVVAPVVAAPAEPEEVEVPAQFVKLVEQIESLSVLELHQLVKVLEKKFGVSAQAVAVATGPAAPAAEEKTEFDAHLTSDGGAKIAVMKVVKEALGLGLKEAKDLVDGIPSVLKTGMKKEDAEALKKQIEDAGGKIELK